MTIKVNGGKFKNGLEMILKIGRMEPPTGLHAFTFHHSLFTALCYLTATLSTVNLPVPMVRVPFNTVGWPVRPV